jgi:NHLM bacteriocin system ABC transporter peptidase/ATP-binding protein
MAKSRLTKTAVNLQMEAVECGAASLAIILEYFGKVIPLEKLRIECGISRDGSRADRIINVAERHGLTTQAFKISTEELKKIEPPFIAFWNYNHFLVIEGFSSKGIHINDPASGHRIESQDEFNRSFSDIVISFKPSDIFIKSGKKASFIALLFRYLGKNITSIYFVLLSSIFLAITGLVIPSFLRIFIDYVLVMRLNDWLKPLILIMLFTASVQFLLLLLQNKCLEKLEHKLFVIHSSKFLWKIFDLPVQFFLQRSKGELSSRINLNERTSKNITGNPTLTLFNGFAMIFYVFVMFHYDIALTFIALISGTFHMGLLYIIATKENVINQKLIRESGNLIGASMMGLQAIETIKSTGAESDFFSKWSGYQAKALNTQKELELSKQILNIFPPFFSTLTIAIILTFGSLRVMSGQLSIGLLIAFLSLMMSFLEPLKRMLKLTPLLNQTKADLGRINDVFAYKSLDIFQPDDAEKSLSVIKLSGKVELKNISFGYNPLEEPLFSNFNLELKPGSRIALVGPSGCGKTTLSKLICGLYKPWEGEVSFDDKVINDFTRSVLSHSLALVSQEIFLFEGTVRDNLTVWDSSIAETTVIQAAKDALIHKDIATRPGGYESHVAEQGSNFSGGQRQRIEIARALATNPTILILDEATSSLDPETEKAIDDNLRRRGCSCVIISHRLSTIRDCDEIIVLDKGQVVQRGTHDELSKHKNSIYMQLINT